MSKGHWAGMGKNFPRERLMVHCLGPLLGVLFPELVGGPPFAGRVEEG